MTFTATITVSLDLDILGTSEDADHETLRRLVQNALTAKLTSNSQAVDLWGDISLTVDELSPC